MAEPVGIASAGIEVAAFALQTAGTVKCLRDTHEFNRSKARVELEFVTRRLKLCDRLFCRFSLFRELASFDLAIANCELATTVTPTAVPTYVFGP
ncbi:hypothetical protein BDV12DRAFT_90870 [Aspergillus spectabilis]